MKRNANKSKRNILFRIFLLLVVKINAHSANFSQKNNSSHEINAYYACLSNRANNLKYFLHHEAKVCDTGEACIMKSNTCLKPFTFYPTVKSLWKKKDYEYSSSNTIFDNMIEDPLTNDLILKVVSKKDEGFYAEIIYDKTPIKQYHLTVSDETLRYPVYENHFISVNESFALADEYLETYTQWNEWTSCACLANLNNSNISSRIRYGNCFLKRSNGTNRNAYHDQNLTRLKIILNLYKNGLPCGSNLLPSMIRKKLNTTQGYVMYGDCIGAKCIFDPQSETKDYEYTEVVPLDKLDAKNEFFKEKIQAKYAEDIKNMVYVTDSELLMVDTNIDVILSCKTEKYFGKHDMFPHSNVYWTLENSSIYRKNDSSSPAVNMTSSRIFIDELFRLNINSVSYSDAGMYTCFFNGHAIQIVLLRINHSLLNEIFVFLTKLGVFLIIFTLLTVVIFSCKN